MTNHVVRLNSTRCSCGYKAPRGLSHARRKDITEAHVYANQGSIEAGPCDDLMAIADVVQDRDVVSIRGRR